MYSPPRAGILLTITYLMNLDLSKAPPALLCRTFDIMAHSAHIDLNGVACLALTDSVESLKELPFALLSTVDTLRMNEEMPEYLDPENIKLEDAVALQRNILLFYKLMVDCSYNKGIERIAIVYDGVYTEIAASYLAGYYILRNEPPEEAIALVALNYPNVGFDYPTICFLDLILECNQKLIEAAETYEVMEVAVTKSGQVVERTPY